MNDIPREKLQYIITKYGRAICDEPKKCEALLRDFCPKYRLEINLLIVALKEKVAAELMNNSLSTMPKEVIFARLIKRLHDNWGFEEEFCQWAVESWALALGVISQPGIIKIQTAKPAQASSQKPSKISKKILKPKYQLRSQPRTLSDEDIRQMIKKHNFFCKKWDCTEKWYNESGNFKNDFEDNGNGTITDHSTGLMWQKSGSDNYMSHNNAEKYINGLNRQRFAGYNDWRLPTIEELASLLESEKQSNDLYIDPIFDKNQSWCWSADKRASGGAWCVHFDYGSIYWNGGGNRGYVRAVRP